MTSLWFWPGRCSPPPFILRKVFQLLDLGLDLGVGSVVGQRKSPGLLPGLFSY
jgi:hypothetical protein